MTPRQYAVAEQELELYFAAAPGIWGLHGVGFDGGAAQVWDGKRVADAHASRWAGRFSPEHEKLSRVQPTVEVLRRVNLDAWLVALLVFAPRRWPPMLAAAMARGARRGNLTGLLLTSGRLERLTHDSSALAMIRFADAHASSMLVDASRKRLFFAPLIAEAEAKLQDALSAYDVLRLGRVRAEAGARRSVVDGLRAVFG